MAATLPVNSLIFWDGTDADADNLSGFSRATAWDGKFLRTGDAGFTTPTNGGGAHDHDQTHIHIGDPHTHSFAGASTTPSWTVTRARFGGSIISALTHSHNSATSNAATIVYDDNTDATTEETADPPHVEIIVLVPDDANQTIPDDALVFSSESSLSGFSTTLYDGKYLKGAASEADAGTTGGSTSHDHELDHTHGVNDHLHAYKTCGVSPGTNFSGLGYTVCRQAHHSIQLASKALSDLSTDEATIDATTFDPEHIKALLLQNTSGGSLDVPVGAIVGYTGTLAALPADWEVWAESYGRYLKITDTASEIGDVGGSNDHVHNRQAHGHTHSGTHDHTTQSVLVTTPNFSSEGASAKPSTTKDHTHTWTVGPSTPTLQNAAAGDTDSADGRPPDRTCLWIRYRGAPSLNVKGGTQIKGASGLAGLAA